jgi:phage gp29-like protein
MTKAPKKSPNRTTPRNPVAATPPAVASTADAYLAFGTGKTDAQMVRRSNLWRDNYNPLRGLVMGRLITIFEAAERGAYAELQLLLRKAEKRYPVLKGFIERLLSSVEELDWDVKVIKNLPAGATPAMAEAQRKFLRGRYDAIKNLNDAIGQIILADIRGYAVLQKHRYNDGGPLDGAVRELYWLEPWVWSRDGYYGDFYYNEISRFGVGLGSCMATFGESSRIGSENLPREDFIVREVESPLYEIALISFVNWLMGRKDWAAFVEIFGLAKGVVIMPPNIASGKQPEYQQAAEKVSDGVSGALPAGSDIKFPTAGVRGEAPFKAYCDAQDEDFVMAATSGILSMLTKGGGGMNQGPHKEHSDIWEKIALMKGKRANETLRTDFDAPELAAEFPGQPVCVQFTLAVQEDEDVNTVADTVVKLEGVGLQVDEQEVSDRTGFKLTRVKLPTQGGSQPGDPDPAAMQDAHLAKAAGRIQNRAPGQNELNDFAAAVAADLKIFRDRAAAVVKISDPDLRKQKIEEFLADSKQMEADILADPASARVLEKQNTSALVAGLEDKPTETK